MRGGSKRRRSLLFTAPFLFLMLASWSFILRMQPSFTEIQSLIGERSLKCAPLEKASNNNNNNNNTQIFADGFPNATRIHDLNDFGELSNLVNFNLPIPRNLNIAFMGDSLTRFQYLDLVYFLSHCGRWIRRDDSPNMVIYADHGKWNRFFEYSNGILHPYEECDCYREQASHNIPKSIENRYFYDKERNNRVSYLNKFGDIPFKSRWDVLDVFNDHGPFEIAKPKFVYQGNWVDSIKDFVCKMEPKPSVLIFNTGLHNHTELMDPRIQKMVVEALKECDIISMYKTTTNRRLEEYEEQLCNQTDFCYDVSWTKPLVPSEHYADRNHFKEPVYSMLNIHLLSMLAEIMELR